MSCSEIMGHSAACVPILAPVNPRQILPQAALLSGMLVIDRLT